MNPYIAGGVVTEQINRQLSTDQEHLQQHTESLAYIHQILCEIKDTLDLLSSGGKEKDFIELINLQPGNEYQIDDHNLRHTQIFAGSTGTITLGVSGVGNINMTLQIGWNVLDLPDRTTITASSAMSLLFKASNWGI